MLCLEKEVTEDGEENEATEVSVVVEKEPPNKYHGSQEEGSEGETGSEEELPESIVDPDDRIINIVDPKPPHLLWKDADHCIEEINKHVERLELNLQHLKDYEKYMKEASNLEVTHWTQDGTEEEIMDGNPEYWVGNPENDSEPIKYEEKEESTEEEVEEVVEEVNESEEETGGPRKYRMKNYRMRRF